MKFDKLPPVFELLSEITLTCGRHNQIKICKIPKSDFNEFSFAILNDNNSNLGKEVDFFEIQPASCDKNEAFFSEYRYESLEEAIERVRDYFLGHKSTDEADMYITKEKAEYRKNLKPQAKELLGFE